MKHLLALTLTLTLIVPFAGAAKPSILQDHHAPKNHKSVRANHQADIVDTAVAAGSFTTLVAAVKAAGLVGVLKGDGPYTVFAPTDEAFAKIPAHTLQSLLKPENRDKLVKILTYHVVPGKLDAQDVLALNGAKTVQGGRLRFGANRNTVRVNNANVLKTDINTRNGIIHVVDTVLLPE
jgi:uncharacterized surface protein with fasciclin (FAS1) repeats